MNFRRHTRPETAVDLTPLIDVVFLLLIFFMVSTRFIEDSSVTLVLPEADAETNPLPEMKSVDVTIAKNGAYAVNGRLLVNDRIETLIRAVREQFPAQLPRVFVIRADALASHQSVVRAMDAAGRMGISEVRITTRPPEE